jgi:dolichol-phosphate mannosyltransferase
MGLHMLGIQRNRLLPVPSGALKIPRFAQTARSEAENQEYWNRSHAERTAGSVDTANTLYFSLVIPTFNERENLGTLVKRLSHILDQALPNSYELIVVDDDSPDHTWRYAQDLALEIPSLQVMRRQQERGLSTAVIRGWQAARGQVLGVIDADLQHPPEVLLQLLDQLQQGADLAVASRHVEGGGVSHWSAARRFLSRGAQLLGLVLLPKVVGRVTDPMSGYFLVRRAAIAEVSLNPLGYKILLEVLGRGRVERIAEVGYVFQEREFGASKVTWRQYKDYIQHLLRLRLDSGRLGRWSQRYNFPLGRFIRFALVGLSGLLVDMAVLYGLYNGLGWGLTRSAIVAAELAILNNFFWNDRWTFRDLARQQQQWRQVLKRLLKFNLICLMGLILKILLLNLLFNGLHLNAYVANFLAIAAVTAWNFWVNIRLNWRVTQVK